MGAIARCVLATFVFLVATYHTYAAEFWYSDGAPGTGVHVVLFGEILPGDEVKVRNEIRTIIAQRKWIERVYVISPGGAMSAALNIGEQIYTLRASTFAPINTSSPGQPHHFVCQGHGPSLEYYPELHRGDPRCTCASACFSFGQQVAAETEMFLEYIV